MITIFKCCKPELCFWHKQKNPPQNKGGVTRGKESGDQTISPGRFRHDLIIFTIFGYLDIWIFGYFDISIFIYRKPEEVGPTPTHRPSRWPVAKFVPISSFLHFLQFPACEVRLLRFLLSARLHCVVSSQQQRANNGKVGQIWPIWPLGGGHRRQ